MRLIGTIAALAALAALGGCNKLGVGAGNSATANAAGNASGGKDGGAPAATASTAGAGLGDKDSAGTATPASAGGAVTVDRAYVTGRWSDKEDCSDAVEFTADGRFVTADGRGGLWNLQGDEMTMSGNGTVTMRIVPIDQNTMTVVNNDGSLGRSTRC
jgi:hypothetical protein